MLANERVDGSFYESDGRAEVTILTKRRPTSQCAERLLGEAWPLRGNCNSQEHSPSSFHRRRDCAYYR